MHCTPHYSGWDEHRKARPSPAGRLFARRASSGLVRRRGGGAVRAVRAPGVRSGMLLHCRVNSATIAAHREGGIAWRRKRHGAPNCEPPKIRPDEIDESLRPVWRYDLFAGMVRIYGPATRPASLGMRGVRLQIRDPGLVPGPIDRTHSNAQKIGRATGSKPAARSLLGIRLIVTLGRARAVPTEIGPPLPTG